jgi:hypothetical protein
MTTQKFHDGAIVAGKVFGLFRVASANYDEVIKEWVYSLQEMNPSTREIRKGKPARIIESNLIWGA